MNTRGYEPHISPFCRTLYTRNMRDWPEWDVKRFVYLFKLGQSVSSISLLAQHGNYPANPQMDDRQEPLVVTQDRMNMHVVCNNCGPVAIRRRKKYMNNKPIVTFYNHMTFKELAPILAKISEQFREKFLLGRRNMTGLCSVFPMMLIHYNRPWKWPIKK